jgi:hypothetical protein
MGTVAWPQTWSRQARPGLLSRARSLGLSQHSNMPKDSSERATEATIATRAVRGFHAHLAHSFGVVHLYMFTCAPDLKLANIGHHFILSVRRTSK